MFRVFKCTVPAPLSIRVQSRESCNILEHTMKVVGIRAPEQGIRRFLYFFYASCVFALVIYLPTGLGLTLFINGNNIKPTEYLSTGQMFINMNGGVLKAIVMMFYLKRVTTTKESLDALDEHVKSESDHQKIHEGVAKSNMIVVVYFLFYLGYIVSSAICGLIIGHPAWLLYNPIFDWQIGVFYLFLQSALEFVVVIMMALTLLVQDTYTIVFAKILRAHLNVLKDHICKLRSDPLKTEDENYAELVDCIKYHKSILDTCNLLRPIMSVTIFIQFLIIGMVLGLTMINLLYFANFFKGAALIMFFIAVIVQTFPFCYQCDALVVECADLAEFLAQSNWLNAEKRYTSTLKIFLHHVQQPIIFIAGSLFPISLMTNIRMAKFAFTVITIVKQMNLDERFK